jgi:hypothetical protein
LNIDIIAVIIKYYITSKRRDISTAMCQMYNLLMLSYFAHLNFTRISEFPRDCVWINAFSMWYKKCEYDFDWLWNVRELFCASEWLLLWCDAIIHFQPPPTISLNLMTSHFKGKKKERWKILNWNLNLSYCFHFNF